MEKEPHKNSSLGQQRQDEWEKIDEDGYRYHKTQWQTPKQSTLAFEGFASSHIAASKSIIDMGAGAGAATAFLASKYKDIRFTAFDYSSELTRLGGEFAAEREIKNLSFEQGDWFDLKPTSRFDGCISLQTLSWLPDYEQPLLALFEKISPQWIGLTSLFYEGDITCRIEVEMHKRNRKTFYNVYSLPAIQRLCEKSGYTLKQYTPFEIDIDIAKPANLDVMGTYTKRAICDDGNGFERLQISGPVLMSWYMLLIEKSR